MPWIGAAAAVGAALIQSNAADKAADKQASAADRATSAQLDMFNATRNDLAPWLGTGNLSLQKLAYLTGLDSGVHTAAPGSVAEDYGGELFHFGDKRPTPGGVREIGAAPTVNQERYAADPIYRAAWDKLAAQHKAAFGVDYQASSSQDWISENLKREMAAMRAAQGIPDPQAQAQAQAQSDPAFGSLTRPFSLADFKESPAYQFNLQQGQKAIEKAAAARKMYYAPQTLQDISKFSQGMASNEFQNAFSNYNTNMRNVWDRLYALSGTGQNAAAQTGAFGTQVGGQIGENMIGAGNAAAAGQVGQANAWANAGSNAYNAYLMNQMLQNNQQGWAANSNGGNSGGAPYAG